MQPRAFFYERAVEGEDFFDSHGDGVIDFGAIEVGKYENGAMDLFCDGDSYVLEQELHLRGGGMRIVDHENSLALMLEEVDAVVHEKPALGTGLSATGTEHSMPS